MTFTVNQSPKRQGKTLTLKALKQASALAGQPELFKFNDQTDLMKRLNLLDAAKLAASDPLGIHGKSISGIKVVSDPRVPIDVLAFYQADKLVKVFALTEEAKASANGYAIAVEHAEAEIARAFRVPRGMLGGGIDKGGHNITPSKVTERPPAPTPTRPTE